MCVHIVCGKSVERCLRWVVSHIHVCAVCDVSIFKFHIRGQNVVHQRFTDTLVTVLCKRTPAWCDGTVYSLGPALSIGWSSMQCSFMILSLPTFLPPALCAYVRTCVCTYVCFVRVRACCACMLCVCVHVVCVLC